MSDKVLVHPKGAIILCSNGHEVAEVIEDLYRGDINYSHKVGNWRPFQTIAKKGCELPLRCFCTAIYFYGVSRKFEHTI